MQEYGPLNKSASKNYEAILPQKDACSKEEQMLICLLAIHTLASPALPILLPFLRQSRQGHMGTTLDFELPTSHPASHTHIGQTNAWRMLNIFITNQMITLSYVN
jgi:hypothetical protein